ncbi:MAG: TetR/AcrR family transcriptional regulator [Maricaulaceae bacterium]|jgi:AcrR family transcriptional regulator
MKKSDAAAAAKKGAYHHGDLKNALLRAAEELLNESDAETLSLRAVARKAGVSAAAPYHHFASKEELLSALAAEGFRSKTEAMLAEAAKYDDPRDKMRALGVAYVRWARQHRGVYKISHGEGRYFRAEMPELVEASEKSYDMLMGHVEAVAALAGEPGKELDEETKYYISTAGWALVHGLAELVADGAVCPPEGVSEEEFVFNVLRKGVAGIVGIPER